MFYWARFHNRQAGTIRAASKVDAIVFAATLGEVLDVQTLPYPASPYLNDMNGHPDFCHSPNHCAGRTACPHSYACSE